MATYNGNNIYLVIGGKDVSALWTDELSFTQSNDLKETTAGAGATHISRGKGLTDTQIDLALVYDNTDVVNYIEKLEPGEEYSVIYGPNSSDAGNPKFAGNMRIPSTAHAVNISRDLVKFNLSLMQSAEPSNEIHNGDTF
jgi:hypothetical protein